MMAVVRLAAAQQPAERVVYDYTAMYDALNPSIVKVHADSGTGSGALVDSRGMVATNHHVVRNARYVAVEFADGRKVAADILLLDARNDLAILKVNASVVGTLKPVPLLPPERDLTVKAGVPVVAFGSPLSQTFLMTQGIVSKVEPGVLLGDFLIQPGNSGGPLVSLAGEVIGINTFAERGISGAVRVNRLRDALAQPVVVNYSGPEPDATPLPFEVKPDFGQTTGSAWMSALAGFSAGYSGRPMTPTRQTMEFKAEFQDLRLYRDGQLVVPITPGRQITEQSINEVYMSFVDEAYSGVYSYDPAVFMSGKSFRLDVYDAREPGRVHKSISLNDGSKLIQQLRRDFKDVISAR